MTFEETEKYIQCKKAVIDDAGGETMSYEASMTTRGRLKIQKLSLRLSMILITKWDGKRQRTAGNGDKCEN